MTPGPLVSIIIPAHNSAQWIRESVGSALNQSWSATEVIVIDDGSTDETPTMLAEFADDRLQVIHQARAGAAAARNTGLTVARGNLVQFLDADDALSTDKVALQVRALEEAPVDSIASCEWFHLRGSRLRNPGERSVWTVSDPIEWLVESLLGRGMMQPACWLTPRRVIDLAGEWDERLTLHDDGDFFARVLAHASNNVFVEGARVLYREHPDSLSRHRDARSAQSAFIVCRTRHSVIASRRSDSKARAAIATQYAQFVYEFGSSAPELAAQAIELIGSLGARPAPVIGGPAFRIAARIAGFPAAMRIRGLSTSIRR